MKIQYLSNSPIPSRKANSIQIMKMCHAFASNGTEVHLYAQKTNENIEDVYEYYGVENNFSIEWHECPKIKWLGLIIYAYRTYKKALKNGPTDLIYGRDLYSIYKLRNFDVPIVFEAHTLPSNIYGQYLFKRLTRNSNFKKLIVTADALKKRCHELYPWLDDENIYVVRNGADAPKISAVINENISFIESKYRVGYVGHLYRGKGMEIISKLVKNMPECEFHIVGGTEEDIGYWSENISFRNIIFHGYIPNYELHKYYDKFDIVLAPYLNIKIGSGGNSSVDVWASPLKVIEYMSYKKAIIASNLPMVSEVIRNRENGLLCDPNNIQSWVDSIRELFYNIDLRRNLQKNAYKEFIEKYTWEKRASKIINILNLDYS